MNFEQTPGYSPGDTTATQKSLISRMWNDFFTGGVVVFPVFGLIALLLWILFRPRKKK
jgi:hypothetical protein